MSDLDHEVLHENEDTGSITVQVTDGETSGRFKVWPDRNQVKPELHDEHENGEDWTWTAREYVRDEFVPQEAR